MSDSYDEGSIMYLLPEYITDIINIISNKRWLIHNFEVTDNELYDPTNYLYHSTLNKTTYTVYLDVNIYQFLINMIKKTEPKKVYREAAAWLVFCQIADIEVDPTLCCYEKLNYQKENIDEVLDDLDIFYSLNNSDPDQLAAFALGVLEHVEIEIEPRKDRNEISKGLLKYNRLIGWDSIYLIILKIIDIKFDHKVPDQEKLKVFVDWTIYDFRRSLMGLVYAAVYFGKKPIGKMMKFKPTMTSAHKRQAVQNMTWDLYFGYEYFKKWGANQSGSEIMFVSDDKALSSLLNSAIQAQIQLSLKPLEQYLDQANYEYLQVLLPKDLKIKGRTYNSKDWDVDYRKTLIEDLEAKIFN